MTRPATPAPKTDTSGRKAKQPRRRPHRPAPGQRGPDVSPFAEQETARAAPDTPAAPAPRTARASTFAELDLPRALIDVLERREISTPFPIQAATLPDALAGRDVLGRARTGSGKTLAYGLALLARSSGHRRTPRRPHALVLVPTRELAQQVRDALEPYGRTLGVHLATVVGGTSMRRQVDALDRGVEVLVATPGRLTDLVERGTCRLDQVRVAVLDEADQMADMGFLPAVSALLDQVAPGGQRLLFSATLDGDVDALVRRYLSDPATHSVDPAAASITTMTHHLLHVQGEHKQRVTAQIAARQGRTLMFVRTKHAADRLGKQLTRSGVRVAALHGDKTQAARTRTLARFRDGTLDTLVATDVAARGIHVDGIDLVVNVDPPAAAKEYLHRSGRTARAGESGAVTTLVTPDQRRGMRRMMTEAGIRADEAGVDPDGEELARLTGAREPSGVPVVEPEEPARSHATAKKPRQAARRTPSGPDRKEARARKPRARQQRRGGPGGPQGA